MGKSRRRTKIYKVVKVIVRHLPPQITEEIFIEQVSPIPPHIYLNVCAGDPSLGEFNYGRAYVGFTKSEYASEFRDKFDQYVFMDHRGHEYVAQVEFAPFQFVPKKTKNTFPKDNLLLESTSEFKQFILQQEQWTSSSLPSAEQYLEQMEKEKKEITNSSSQSKLLEFVNQRHAEKLRQKDLRKRKRKSNLLADENVNRFEVKLSSKIGKERSSKTKVSEIRILTRTNVNKDKKSNDKSVNDKITGKEAINKEIKILKNEDKDWRSSKSHGKQSGTSSEKRKSNTDAPTFTVKVLAKDKSDNNSSNRDLKSKIKSKDDKYKDGERKIKLKDKPSIELYRPGSRKLSKTTDDVNYDNKDSIDKNKKKNIRIYTRTKPQD